MITREKMWNSYRAIVSEWRPREIICVLRSPAVLALALLGVCLALPAAEGREIDSEAVGEVLLFDFSGSEPLAGWDIREGAELSVTDAWSSRGERSAAITFYRWEPVAPYDEDENEEDLEFEDDIEGLAAAARAESRTPAAVVTRESGLLEPLDRFNSLLDQSETTELDYLEFDLYNPQDFPVTLEVGFSEADRRLAPRGFFTVPPRSSRSCSLVLGQPEADSRLRLLDVQAESKVESLSFSMMLPDRDTTIYVDNVRLRADLEPEIIELAAIGEDMREQISVMSKAVRGEAAYQVSGFGRMTERLRQDLDTNRFDTWEELREARDRLRLLQSEFDRMQPLFQQTRIQAQADMLARGGADAEVELSEYELLPAAGELWEFRTDPEEQGIELGWHRHVNENEEWKKIPVPARWSETDVGRYHGYGWYRTVFSLPEELAGCTLQLNFEAVDEQAWIYVNGELVGEHTVESTGLGPGGLWRKPFSVNIPAEHLNPGEDNLLVIRVHAQAGEAGIWKDVSTSFGKVAMVLGVDNSMRQVFLEQERFRAEFRSDYHLQGARNEYESFQTVIVPVGHELRNVRWELDAPRNEKGDELPATVRVVGYVDTDQPRYTVPHTGWWSDPLLDFLTGIEHVPADEVAPLWVTVQVPEDAAAGMYHGKLTVRADNAEAQTLPFSFEVWDFDLPQRSSLPALFSMNSLTAVIPNTLYGRDKAEEMQEIYENWLLREYRIDPTFIYGSSPPRWDAERLSELLDMGMRVLRVISINPRRGQPLPENYWEDYFETRASRAEDYFQVLDEARIDEREDVLQFTYLFDEWSDSQDGGLDIVHETARRLEERRWSERPGILHSSCAYDRTYGLERPDHGAIDIWFPGMRAYERARAHNDRAREAGQQIWWYFAIGNFSPTPNWWIESPSIEPRLIMGAMTAKFRPDGFMYYNINRWWEMPTDRWQEEHGGRGLIDEESTDGVRTKWHPNSIGRSPGSLANGDGSLICPGPNGPLATIRLENIRDGMQDYEYYLILGRLLEESGLPLDEAEVDPEVVEGVTDFTADPAVVEAERERLARRIVQLKRNLDQ